MDTPSVVGLIQESLQTNPQPSGTGHGVSTWSGKALELAGGLIAPHACVFSLAYRHRDGLPTGLPSTGPLEAGDMGQPNSSIKHVNRVALARQ